VFGALSRRLAVRGLVAEDGAVLVSTGSALDLAERRASRVVETTADLIFLPDEDDLLVVADWPDGCEPEVATMTALPAHLHDMTVRDLLTQRIAARTITGLADTVVGPAEEETSYEPLNAMARARPATHIPICPVLRCTGTVRWAPHIAATLDVCGSRGRSLSITLPESAGVAQRWLATAALLGAPRHRAAVVAAIDPALDPQLLRENENDWHLGLTGDQAIRLSPWPEVLSETFG
jgi:hypothetical protein